MSTRYVELTARSCFSFLRGASQPAALVRRAHELGYDCIALTDCDGLYGMVRAHEEAVKVGIKLIVGAELTLGLTAPFAALTLLVENHTGYTNLCRILTESHRQHSKGKARKPDEGLARNIYAGVSADYVCKHTEGLWALFPSPVQATDHERILLQKLRGAFGKRAFIAAHQPLDGTDELRERAALTLASELALDICACNAVRYAHKGEKPLFDVLHCIREGITLEQAGRSLTSNAEAYLKSDSEMRRLFAKRPEWVEQTRRIADSCTFKLTELRYRFPQGGHDYTEKELGISEILASTADTAPTADAAASKTSRVSTPLRSSPQADRRLRVLTYKGAERRYDGKIPAQVVRQLEKELALIAELEVASYFLCIYDIVEIARKRDILCQGRGSAANSAVCYCLGITAVDPARSSLLFERFLSAERREPPDIDIDFEHERREEVIQEIYARYGRDRAAMVSEVICYRGKSALRETGKVFGLTLKQIDELSSLVSWWDKIDSIHPRRLSEAHFDPNDERIRLTLRYAQALQGIPRHLSIHVGGFVLSEEPLNEVAPIEPATMPGRTVIPWDKDDLDTLGFFKVDILGLGMLTAIRKTLELAQRDSRIRAESAIDRLAKIPPEDPLVYEALRRADTVGVFQIESRAQMAMLPRLKPEKFYDLVVEVAIVRPGPIQGGMVHPYLRRRNGEEPCDSPHPLLAPILDRTLGVPLFQEQVMQIAIAGAGYSAGEADQLRRDMAAWRRNGNLERHRTRLLYGFFKNGIAPEFSERLFRQIEGFGEYGFPESHAASFALLVYASSWLKLHHPAEFAAALINSQPMGFYSPSTILNDAKKHGVEVRPVCIQKSAWDCTLESSGRAAPAIRIGLRLIRGLGEAAARHIESARCEKPFENVEDLAARALLKKDKLHALAQAGALEQIAPGRRAALWQIHAPRTAGLFRGRAWSDTGHAHFKPLTRAEQLSFDYHSTGVSVDDHPLKLLRNELPDRIRSARALAELPHGAYVDVAGLVICRQRPATASGVVFITMEDETGFINLVLWSRIFERFRRIAIRTSLLHARGKLEREGGIVHVIVDSLAPLNHKAMAAFAAPSRDFH